MLQKQFLGKGHTGWFAVVFLAFIYLFIYLFLVIRMIRPGFEAPSSQTQSGHSNRYATEIRDNKSAGIILKVAIRVLRTQSLSPAPSSLASGYRLIVIIGTTLERSLSKSSSAMCVEEMLLQSVSFVRLTSTRFRPICHAVLATSRHSGREMLDLEVYLLLENFRNVIIFLTKRILSK